MALTCTLSSSSNLATKLHDGFTLESASRARAERAIAEGYASLEDTDGKAGALAPLFADGRQLAQAHAAFAALPAGTVDTLLEPENKEQLTSVLTYHVVAGEYMAADTAAGTYELETLQGDTVNVVVSDDGSVTVDGANVVSADVDASNGVIHVIDAVIMPGE